MTAQPTRGRLTVYLGAAPGVGKTYQMLLQGHALKAAGRDVVVGLVETHQRAATAALVGGLEVIARTQVPHRGRVYGELDVAAILERAPEVVLVDELAHTVITPDDHVGPERKRYEDVEVLLEAGIEVISTVNIQHVESLNDVVYAITGQVQRETLPDAALRAADEVELVDLSPQTLRTRLAKGLIYPAERVDAALAHYFRIGNLIALRELALLWLADKVDEGLASYRASENIDTPWPARERVMVAVTGGPESKRLIRRGMRIVGRTPGRELVAVHVVQETGMMLETAGDLQAARELTETLGGTWHTVSGDDVAATLLDFAHTVNATQIVIGTARSPWRERLLGTSVSARVVANAGALDVYMVSRPDTPRRLRLTRPRREGLTLRRKVLGWICGLLGPVLLTAFFSAIGQNSEGLTLCFLAFLTAVVFVAILGGLWPALACALVGTGLLNWFFTQPVGTFTIAEAENIIALVIFIVVAVAVALVVDTAAVRAAQAKEAKAEALMLSELAGTVVREGSNVLALLTRIAQTLGQRRVSLESRREGRWVEQLAFGDADAPVAATPTRVECVPVGEDDRLVLDGRTLSAGEQRILDAYAGRIQIMLHKQELQATRLQAQRLEAANAVRTALLRAVSHDLRTPLSSIKAAASSLRMDDVVLPEDLRDELLATIEESSDRLEHLVTNLLDMSRIHSGALDIHTGPVDIAEVLASVWPLLDPGSTPQQVTTNIPADLPLVDTDVGLIQRVFVNLIENAAKYGGSPVVIDAAAVSGAVTVRVVDNGPGVPDDKKADLFTPFTRLDDSPGKTGLGLGLAVAHGLAEACGATLAAEDTPGGGLTMTMTMPLAHAREPEGKET